MLSSNKSASRAMVGPNRPQRFKLSLPFLRRKKKSNKNLLEEGDDGPDIVDLSETGLGDLLQDIAEENEEQLHENGDDHVNDDESAEESALDNDDHDENLTLALVPKTLSPLELHKDLLSVKVPTSYKSYDIIYPPVMSPASRRKTERSSSTKAFDSSTTRSTSVRTESTSQMSSGGKGNGKGWLRCGFGSCSKQIDMERELRVKDKRERSGLRRQRSRTISKDAAASWEREDEWSALAEEENDLARKKMVMRKQRGHKKSSSKLAPSPGISPSKAMHAATPETKCSLRDAYEEVREAAKYDLPAQRSDQYREAELVCSGGSRRLETDLECNTGEERANPWERSVSSPSSDEELFTTSFELDGQSNKTRRKKWSSNSSDETEGRQRRAAGFYVKPKSSWSSHSIPSAVQEEGDIVESRKTRGKKGSRIIFLSTPPRLKELGMDEDEPTAANDHLVVKSSSDRFGEYCKLEPATKESRLERTFSMGYKSNASFEADMEANAKAWSKLEVRTIRRDDSFSDAAVRELPLVSRSKEHLRHIDVQIEDQLVNLRLESDVSDDSQGKTYCSSRGSRRYTKGVSKSLDQDKPAVKKKRGTHSRRRRSRKTRAPPPPLPSDLHGKVKESVAVVKSSYDPYTDFRDSMVEMIVEKEIQGATDLEELLRCYLSLNSAEYHSVIVKVFADVWRQLFADTI